MGVGVSVVVGVNEMDRETEGVGELDKEIVGVGVAATGVGVTSTTALFIQLKVKVVPDLSGPIGKKVNRLASVSRFSIL